MKQEGKAQPSSSASYSPTARDGREVNHGTPTPGTVEAPVLQTELNAALCYVAAVHELLEWARVGLVPKRTASVHDLRRTASQGRGRLQAPGRGHCVYG